MKILVLNAGSSSLKYQVLDMTDQTVVVKGIVEKIGVKGSSVKNHHDALLSVLADLSAHGTIDAIGHRVVHGGEYFQKAVEINDDVIAKIQKCNDLAPLHNPANVAGILACKELFPGTPQVAVFDTAFHQSMEPAHYLYAIPYKYYEQYKIRRYGFHGISHQYVYQQLIQNPEFKVQKNKVITCHVGNGVSLTAIKDGKALDTSMGMTPLEGLMMGTRSGNIDPAIIPYLMNHEKLDADQINDLLNKQSGLLGVSGISSDMRDIVAGIEGGNKKCSLALDMYISSLVKYIGAYAALMGGVDAIVLTAGVMENSRPVRKLLMEKLGWLGVRFAEDQNDFAAQERVISTKDSKVMVVVIPTDEELMIAKEVLKSIKS